MILVTGATGLIGSRVLAGLTSVEVRAFTRGNGGDFGRPETIRAALEGVDAVFLATPNHARQYEYEVNVIDAARTAGVRRVVKLSAAGAEPGSPVEFWDVHGRAEAYLEASGLDAAILRPTCFMTHLPAATGAPGAVAAIDPDDVAAAAVAVLTEHWQPGVHVLTGPEAIGFEAPPLTGALGALFAALGSGAQRRTTGAVLALTGREPRAYSA